MAEFLKIKIPTPLVNDSVADPYHRHSELSASDGTPNAHLKIDEDGNIGVNIDTPRAPFHIRGVGNAPVTIHGETMLLVQNSGTNEDVDDDCQISIVAGNTGESELFFGDFDDEDIGRVTYNHWNDSMYFQTNTLPRMAILNNGRVGINTVSPTQLLEVKGSGAADAMILVNSTTTDSYPSLRFTNDVQEWRFYGADGSQSDSFNIYNGTNPNKGTKFLILPNGNVGIGTVSPGEKLEVNGRIIEQGTFAEIYVADGSTAQTIPTGATYTKLTGFVTNGQSANCTPDADNDKITVTKTGIYFVCCSIGAASDTVASFKFAIFLNGVEQSQCHTHRKYANANDVGACTLTGIIDVTTASWDLDIRTVHDNGGNVDWTPSYMNLTIYYLGET